MLEILLGDLSPRGGQLRVLSNLIAVVNVDLVQRAQRTVFVGRGWLGEGRTLKGFGDRSIRIEKLLNW